LERLFVSGTYICPAGHKRVKILTNWLTWWHYEIKSMSARRGMKFQMQMSFYKLFPMLYSQFLNNKD